jgi:hypothetical protein
VSTVDTEDQWLRTSHCGQPSEDNQDQPDVEFLSFRFRNAGSRNNKLPELHQILWHDNSDASCVTETWLNSVTTDSLTTDGCKRPVFHTNRRIPHIGGGVCIIVNNDTVKAIPIPLPSEYFHLKFFYCRQPSG